MKILTFSYDDGVQYDERLMEIFMRYGMRCTWNINSGLMSEKNVFQKGNATVHRLSPDKLVKLYGDHEIAVHMVTHPDPTALSKEKLYEEIADDKAALETLFKRPVVGMAYPFGRYNDEVVEAVRACGIRYARTVQSTRSFVMPTDLLRLPATCHHKDEELFALAEAFLKAPKDENLLFYVWGHSYEFEEHQNWQRIEDFCKMMAGRDDIAYLDNAQALL